MASFFQKGECFSNVPDLFQDYVPRPHLENALYKLLIDDKRTIVTLVGRGGIGKTSLALKVIPRLYEKSSFDAIVWFSARDVDLQLSGPKSVRALVLSPDDMGKYYATLVLSSDAHKNKGFNARIFLEGQLQKSDFGPCLFVFDNFETTQNPIEMFNWLDTFVRPPNKILITTRLRDFKGDYPLEVQGMEYAEARQLAQHTATHLGISNLLNEQYIETLINESGGHPYVIKILLGDVSRAGRITKISRIIAGSDEILTALFERTYASLSPCAQRAFLTLSAWNSSVPRIALEGILQMSTSERLEVERGIESLLQYSMADIHIAPTDGQEFISLPLVATAFGKKKLNISPFRTPIQDDVEKLQMFGPSRGNDIHLGLAKKFETFLSNISRRIDKGEDIDSYAPVMEMICRAYPPGWLLLSRLHIEKGTEQNFESAKNALHNFLEIDPTSGNASEAWRMLANVCYRTGDSLGEIRAFIERAQISSVPFTDLSNTANQLNSMLRRHVLTLDNDEKRQLVHRIIAVMEKRTSEAQADDFSRMAWLAFHLGENNKARAHAASGLAMDPDNYYCQRISARFAPGN